MYLFRFSRQFVLRFVVTALMFAVSSPLLAQMKAQQLLSTSVEKYDAKYDKVQRAIELFQAKELKASQEMLAAVKKEHPEIAPSEVLLGLLHFAAQQRAAGEASLDDAILKYPHDPEAFILIAELAMRDRHRPVAQLGYDRAQQALAQFEGNDWRKKVLQIRLHAGMSSLEETRGRHKESIAHLKQWIELDPQNPLAIGSLGRQLFRSGQYADARTEFENLVKLAPNAPPVDIAMGRLYSDAGMEDEALKSMTAAVTQFGDDIRTRITVAEWSLSNNHLALANENVEAALKIDKDAIGALVLKARIARLENDHKTAESILSAAILAHPNDFTISNELARTLAVLDDEEKRKTGLKYAQRSFQFIKDRKTPAGRESVMTFAWLLLKNGEPEKAEKVLHSMPENSTVSSENAYIAGEIYAARTRRELAKQTLKAALANKAPFPGRDNAEKLLKELSSN